MPRQTISYLYTKIQSLKQSFPEASHVPAAGGGPLQLPGLSVNQLSNLPGAYEPTEALKKASLTRTSWTEYYTSFPKVSMTLHMLLHLFIPTVFTPSTNDQTAFFDATIKFLAIITSAVCLRKREHHVGYKESSMKTGRTSFSHPQYI